LKDLSSLFGYLGVGLLAAGVVLELVPGMPGAVSATALLVGGLAVAGFIGMNAGKVASGLGRRTSLGANAALLVFIFLGIMVLVNFLSARHHHRFDVTADKRYSLSPQTLKILNGLDRDIVFAAFYKDGEGQAITDLLQEYDYHCDRITFELIDPDRHPGKATQYGVSEYGTTVAVCADRQERFAGSTEQDVTNAILKLTREGSKTVLFLKGQGEKDPFSDERDGYATARKAIEGDNYEVRELLLMQEGVVPGDCSALIIAGPRKEVLPHEEKAIADYAGKGGTVLFLLDPAPAAGLEHLLRNWGVTAGPDVVVDVSGVGQLFGADEFMPVVTSFGQTEITRGFALAAFFPFARSVTEDTAMEAEVHIEMLAETSPQSWAETGSIEDDIIYDEGQDRGGPVPLAVVVTSADCGQAEQGDFASADARPGPKIRLVVCGDSDFASNAYFGLSGNGDLFLNMVSWLAEEEDLIAIRPKASGTRPLVMSLNQAQSVFWFVVVTIPAMVMIAGLSMWWRRRR